MRTEQQQQVLPQGTFALSEGESGPRQKSDSISQELKGLRKPVLLGKVTYYHFKVPFEQSENLVLLLFFSDISIIIARSIL